MVALETILATQGGKSALDLAQRALGRFSNHWRRLGRVRNAYLEDDPRGALDPAIATALKDLYSVLGQQGQLTEALARFLDKLSSSGLLDHLALIAVTNVNGAGTFPTFSLMYQAEVVIGGSVEIPAETLYRKIIAMLRASILGNENADKYYSRERLAILRESAVQGEQALKLRFAPTRDGKVISEQEVISQNAWLSQERQTREEIISRLARAIAPRFATIRVEGPSMRSIEVEASRIYVESAIGQIAFNPTDLHEGLSPDDANAEISVSKFLGQLDRAAIVGDPGGGKSTLARMMCRDLLAQSATSEGPFPIFVTLRKFYAARRQDVTTSLFEYALKELCEQANDFTPDQIRNPVLYMLSFGRAVVVLDGLDEILSIAQRRDFGSAVGQFCSSYSLSRFLATSRKVDYKQVSLSGFSTYELKSFDDERVRQYVELSALNVFNKPPAQINVDVQRFMDAVRRNAPEFRSNPLLLSLIVWLFNSTQRIPDNRAEIYEECSRLLFERWDSLREISADVPDAHRLFALLGYLASEMYLQSDLQNGASREWLGKAIRDYFVSDYNESAESRAANAANKFLEHLSGRAWVLRAIANDRYEFTHRTFMEYFFAKYLNDKHLSLDSLFDELSPHIKRGEWDVPAHLALQICISGKRNYAERTVQRLISLYGAARSPGMRATVAEFVARATEYLQPSEASLERIAKIITLEVDDNSNWKSCFVSILQTPNEMRRSIFRGLGKGFADLIDSGRLHRMSFILDWLKACAVANTKLIECELPPRLVSLGNVQELISDEIQEAVTRLEGVSAAAAKARFDLKSEFDPQVVREFGLRLWLSSSEGPLRRLDWRSIDFTLMLAEFSSILSGERELNQCAYARLAIALAESDFTRYPLAITQSAIVIEDSNHTYPLRRFYLSDVSRDLSGGLAMAVMGFDETSRNARIPEEELKRVLVGCIRELPEMSGIREFANAWMKGMTNLFQARQPGQASIVVSKVLR